MRLKIAIHVLFSILLIACDSPQNQLSKYIKSNKLNLDSLLALQDTTTIMIAIDEYINASLTVNDSLNNLSEPQRNFYCIQELEREVNNGGFNQFFLNSSGDFAKETVLALKAIGANNTFKMVESAINEFPNHIVPKNRSERKKLVTKIECQAQKVWDRLDNEFYTYPDNLDSLNLEYVKKNKKHFEKSRRTT